MILRVASSEGKIDARKAKTATRRTPTLQEPRVSWGRMHTDRNPLYVEPLPKHIGRHQEKRGIPKTTFCSSNAKGRSHFVSSRITNDFETYSFEGKSIAVKGAALGYEAEGGFVRVTTYPSRLKYAKTYSGNENLQSAHLTEQWGCT